MFLLCDVDTILSVIPANFERLMFRNVREIEVRVYKDKTEIVRKMKFSKKAAK
jgi:hypothetical protein